MIELSLTSFTERIEVATGGFEPNTAKDENVVIPNTRNGNNGFFIIYIFIFMWRGLVIKF
jgi:hypothetical protein